MLGRALLIVVAGCGRLGFDSPIAIDASSEDASGADGLDAAVCAASFCDGFEDPALSAWTLATESGASADRDATFGFRGASLHAISPVGTNLAARHVDVFPGAPTDQWVRLYIYAASGMPLDLEPVELANVADTHQLVFSLYDDDIDIHGHGLGGEFSAFVGSAPPRDTWVCYELHVAIAANGMVELFRDGALLVAESAIDTRPPGGDLSRLFVGIPNKPTALGVNIFVDEVVADTSRIGCL